MKYYTKQHEFSENIFNIEHGTNRRKENLFTVATPTYIFYRFEQETEELLRYVPITLYWKALEQVNSVDIELHVSKLEDVRQTEERKKRKKIIYLPN